MSSVERSLPDSMCAVFCLVSHRAVVSVSATQTMPTKHNSCPILQQQHGGTGGKTSLGTSTYVTLSDAAVDPGRYYDANGNSIASVGSKNLGCIGPCLNTKDRSAYTPK